MPRGGKREGAGRKKGSRTTKTTKTTTLAQQAAGGGSLPLEVMLAAMRHHEEAGNLDRAAAFAKDAAPYLHPRLNAVAHTGLEDVLNRLPPDFGAEVRRALAAPVPGGNGQADRNGTAHP